MDKRDRYRARKREGKIVLRVEVDKEAISTGLYSAGYLPLEDLDDSKAINAAFERYAIARFED